jgi:hypothetical protein
MPRHCALLFSFLLLCLTSTVIAEDAPLSEAAAKAAFVVSFRAGKEAVLAKDWPKAAELLQKALRDLGTYDHDDKSVAQILLDRAQALSKPKVAAETPKPVPVDPPKSADSPKKESPAPAAALEIPSPRSLSPDDWTRGPGSACFWTGDLLYLEEGDEYYKKTLKGDFALALKVDARMDEQSRINIELRSTKDSSEKVKVTGWGSKEGSAPFLEANGERKGKGEGRPRDEVITLAFVRTGKKIEFYCDGTLIGSTKDVKEDTAFNLWVSGKGRVLGLKITGR